MGSKSLPFKKEASGRHAWPPCRLWLSDGRVSSGYELQPSDGEGNPAVQRQGDATSHSPTAKACACALIHP